MITPRFIAFFAIASATLAASPAKASDTEFPPIEPEPWILFHPLSASFGPRLLSEGSAAYPDIMISPLRLQLAPPCWMRWASVHAAVGFSFTADPEIHGFQFEAGTILFEHLVTSYDALRIPDHGWNQGVRISITFDLNAPLRGIPGPKER